jgi:hypothetical protein
MGFTRCILPRTFSQGGSVEKKMGLIRIGNLKELLENLF